MRTFQQISALRTYLRSVRNEGKSIGLVPTMGALHAGHMSLAQRAKGDCDITVVSIFVNPTQFAPNEDFQSYPRDINRDLQLTAHFGIDAIFNPTPEEVYPAGFETWIETAKISKPLEGGKRPEHFRGVATVVAKLLNIVQPDIAYFGQKDYQQFLVIERMAKDLNLPYVLQMVPTQREPDGLAMSSRNAYLSPDERQSAPALYRALQRAATKAQEGVLDTRSLLLEIEHEIAGEPLAQLDYVAIVNADTLEPIAHLEDRLALAALAVRFGKTRLIDNILLTPPGLSAPRLRRFAP